MDSVEKLLQGFATLLWPLIVIVVVLFFRPAVRAIIESAKSRKFTLKIGGQELTMDEANQVQQALIADLQGQVSELRKKVEQTFTSQPASGSKITDDLQIVPLIPQQTPVAGVATKPSKGVSAPPDDMRRRPEDLREESAVPLARGKVILWVDDNPKNNSYFVQQLLQLGIRVDLATTTSDALARFHSQKYDCIISDMGRVEKGAFQSRAGLDFLADVRKADTKVPFVLFSSPQAMRQFGQEALAAGATAVTSSTTELFGILNLQVAMQHG